MALKKATSSAIKVDKLTKKYKKLTAVDAVSFQVKKGQIFAFLGPNGAGKTTTIKMLTTLLQPTSGSIKINGFTHQSDQNEIRRSFGIVFQDSSLDDELTAYENLHFHGVLYRMNSELLKQKIQEMLSFVALWDRKDTLVKTFSGGMKRRLEIARGLLHHPQLFFLDEPTIGLDPQTRNNIWTYLKNLNKKENLTIFFTTHYIEEAQKIANQVAIIDQGKIVAQGSPNQLIKKTKTKTLEEAYLSLTGKDIREQMAGFIDELRAHRKIYTGKQK